MEAYGEFAGVYDELMDNVPYDEWCEHIVRAMERYGVSRPVRSRIAGLEPNCARETVQEPICSPETGHEPALAAERDLVLDLGCGTGTMTRLLYRKGYDVIGVDSSEEMLSAAMEKNARTGEEILYLLQDMRELDLYSTVGTAVSVCDSLNYLLEEEDLLEVFRRVNNFLYPGGIFVFDFNTVYKYERILGNTTIAENREDCSFIWENFYDPEERLNEYDLTVFVREENGLFKRFTETHLQRGYTAEQMTGLLERAGMSVLEVRDADTDGEPAAESGRIRIVAGENGKERERIG